MTRKYQNGWMVEWSKRLSLSPANWLILLFSVGLILVGTGAFFYKSGVLEPSTKVEIISETSEKEITVEIAGEVEKPGVYKMPSDSRVEDLLTISGGLSAGANRGWIEKYLNRAAKLSDSQKIYIPSQSEEVSAKSNGDIKIDQSVLGLGGSGLTNINTATLNQLDELPGIGHVYGQSIIDHRPYSTADELVSKGALKQSVYDKLKDLISVY